MTPQLKQLWSASFGGGGVERGSSSGAPALVDMALAPKGPPQGPTIQDTGARKGPLFGYLGGRFFWKEDYIGMAWDHTYTAM